MIRIIDNYDCLDQTIKLNIMNCKGEVYNLDLSENTTIENLKNICLSYFRKSSPWDGNNLYSFRLISVQKNKPLNNNKKTLKEEQLNSGDYLIMKKKKSPISDKRFQTITKQQIEEATKSIPSRNSIIDDNRFCLQKTNQNNFCKDIRKVLITLVDYSINLLSETEQVKKILNFSNEINLEMKLNFLKEDEINEDALKKLTDMGFNDSDAKRALKLNNNPIDAIHWLLAIQSNKTSNEEEAKLNSNELIDKIDIKSTNFKQTYYDKNELYDTVPKLIECYRKFKRYTFFYNKKSFENMKAIFIGQEEEIADSLWIHNNNEHVACEMLLSNRRAKLEELNIGLLRGSQLYNELIKNPIIQLGLLKPKVLFAFLHLIEEPQNTNRWSNDNELSQIITQIFRVYHSEKQSLLINQPLFMNQTNNQRQRNQCYSRNCSIDQINFNTDYSTPDNILFNINNLSLNDNQDRQNDWTETNHSLV